MRFESLTRTHVGCRRKTNEDATLFRPDLGLWAVADGMGGHHAGEVASALVTELLGSGEKQASLGSRVAAARDALQDANRQLQAMAAGLGRSRTIGSTVVLLASDLRSFTCLWAGDSRAYLVRDGKLKQLTHDHSLVQQLVDVGDLDPSAASNHPNANIITRAVGAAPDLDIDSVDGDVRAGDIFFLTSDGVTRLLDDSEVLTLLLSADLDAAADQIVDICLARKAPDNLTFVILKVYG